MFTLTIIAIIALTFIVMAGASPTPALDSQIRQLRNFQLPEELEEFDRKFGLDKPKRNRRVFSDQDHHAFRDTVNTFARTGTKDAFARELTERFATITTETANGLMLPESVAFLNPGESNVYRAAYNVWGLSPLSKDRPMKVKVPVLDSVVGSTIAENASSEPEITDNLTESFALDPEAFTSGYLYVSRQALDDGADIQNSVVPGLTYLEQRALEESITEQIINDGDVVQSVTTATVGGFTRSNLVSLNRALPRRYRSFRVMVLSATAFTAAEQLTDGAGSPVLRWQGNQAFFGPTPVFESNYQELGSGGRVVGAIYSLLAFALLDSGQTQLVRIDNIPRRPGQVGFSVIGLHAADYAVSGVCKLVTPAS